MSGITYVLTCDRCGYGWVCSTPLEFGRLTDAHRAAHPSEDDAA